ncbi:hypothetical protein Nepgr_020042 [Nepenthes gracilis]|uniref:ARM repeat superfamily protein n=1 Tax=Nepenthes gracilis TaxID=150966 RepID=A0AAD3SYA3_NEPGR|nr:hypothetical protein Nepgr_020042 [Nepenthes gracilis]
MGVVSRRVVPACGNLCCFCPSLRARSRQPVKRYKKLLAEIFPRSQNAEPNERKIGKLCEYASKNPLRIPKILDNLEQRFYKDLRSELIGSVKIVLCIYRKLLSACKEQMPLFAGSLLGIIRTLLEQTPQHDIQVLGCNVLVDFINCQVDGTYMFQLEELVPKLCQLTQEVGNDDRALCLRAAGLQAIASMVSVMGKHSYISMDLDKIISVTLENYADLEIECKTGKRDGQAFQSQNILVQQITREEDPVSSFPNSNSKSLLNITNTKYELQVPVDASKSPAYWSRVCIQNMAGLAKEVTTVRRVLEPFFHFFDSEDYWSMEKGLACSVLMYLQLILDESGENSHLLLSLLIKHLDHKNVMRQPVKQISIINVTTQLAETARQQASVALIGALSDLVKHLCKYMQYSSEASSSLGDGIDTLNVDLLSAIKKCMLQLSYKIGDMGPILDMMAVVLEKLSSSPTVARTTIYSVYQTIQIVSSLPNILYHKKAFPDALFHQLLLIMTHPDHETRIGAHSVFSLVLMPSVICPWFERKEQASLKCWTISSVIASQKAKTGRFIMPNESDKPEVMDTLEGSQSLEIEVNQSTVHQSLGRSCSFKISMINGEKFQELASLRLSTHQIRLLLSSIWIQAASTKNTPANFVAIAHTYTFAVLFTLSKDSGHEALIRCFQLAFSLRSISLDQEGGLQPSHRRSLFTLASCMLIFLAGAGNFLELIPIVKSSLTDRTVDPYLELNEDFRLQAVEIESDSVREVYGSDEDDAAALKCLSAIKKDDQQLKEIVISYLMSKFEKLSEEELCGIKKQLSQKFSSGDSYPLEAQLFMETSKPGSPLAQRDFLAFDEAITPAVIDEEAFTEENGSQSGRKTSVSVYSLDILSVNELLDSALETASQVASLPISSTAMPYDQVKNRCEAFVTGKHKKMSVLHSIKQQQEPKAIIVSCTNEEKMPSLPTTKMEDSDGELKLWNKEPILGCKQIVLCSTDYRQQRSFRLPPSSPYDCFLKAAGG